MSSAAHELAVVYGYANRPPVRFLFVGSTTAAYFLAVIATGLGTIPTSQHRNIAGAFSHFFFFCAYFQGGE